MSVGTSLACDGHVAPGYESLRDAFRAGLSDFGEGGGALCVYVGGVKVVDLWGGQARPGMPWAEDTMSAFASATKGAATLAVQIAADRGLIDVEAPVSQYWPEFGANGKEAVRVRHLLDHTSGVLFPDHPEAFLDWEGRGWDDLDEIATRLARARPVWEPGTKIAYHGVTCGWFAAVLIKRVTGKTIGAFFRDEVAAPLGLDLWIGTPASEHGRVAQLIPEREDDLPAAVRPIYAAAVADRRRPGSILGQSLIQIDGVTIVDVGAAFLSKPRVRELELPFGGGLGTARSLARMYALLSMGGELDGVRLVSEGTVRQFATESASGPDATWPHLVGPGGTPIPPPVMHYGLGYRMNEFAMPMIPAGGDLRARGSHGPEPSAFGHGGHGGQVGFCDPVNRVGFGFVRSRLTLLPAFSAALVDELYRILGVLPAPAATAGHM